MKKTAAAILAALLLMTSACGNAGASSGGADSRDAAASAAESAAPTDAAPSPEISAAPSPTPSARPTVQPAANGVKYPLDVKCGEKVSADLDGDGEKDTICYVPESGDADKYWRIGSLTVNGTDFTDDIYGQGFHSDTPDADWYALTDLDKGDGLLEIAVQDWGPSDDCITSFFRYDGAHLRYIGCVSGLVRGQDGDSDLTFYGDGTVGSYTRLAVFQTWFSQVVWAPDGNGFSVVPQDVYYSKQTYAVTAAKDLAVYAEADESSPRTTLSSGAGFTVIGTDNSRWVLCRDGAGAEFWLHLDEDGFMTETADGSYSWEAVDGLCMAD